MNLEEKRKKLFEQVEASRKEIRADRMDMSFGEIMNMYDEGELIISPEFQRAFRWGRDKQTKFIESLILGIPIPPIFVAETKGNVWELVDGLQRISTVLSFFGKLNDREKNNLVLEKTSILTAVMYALMNPPGSSAHTFHPVSVSLLPNNTHTHTHTHTHQKPF